MATQFHLARQGIFRGVATVLDEFTVNNGYSTIPNGHFAINPAADIEIVFESDLAKLPTERGAWIIIPRADTNAVGARGFTDRESNANLCLMWRQFPDGALGRISPTGRS